MLLEAAGTGLHSEIQCRKIDVRLIEECVTKYQIGQIN